MTSDSSLSAEVIGQIALMQSVVTQLPDKKSMLSFACQGLKDVAGVAEAFYSHDNLHINQPELKNSPDRKERIFPIKRGKNIHADIILRLQDTAAFLPYTPYIENFCNMLAVVFEELHQREENRRLLDNLENRVESRTKELEIEIKERQKAENELSYSNSLTNAALEASADGILIVKRDGKIARWNENFISLWQVPKEILETELDAPVLQHAVSQVVSPHEFLHKVNELYDNPDRSSNDLLYLTDGRIFERFSQPVRINEEIVARFWSFRDITERKKNEQLILAERDRAQKYLDTVEAIIIALDDQGRVSLINRKGCEIIGRAESDLIGASWFETCLPHGDNREKALSYYRELMRGKIQAAEYFENTIASADGDLYEIAWHNSLLQNEEGIITGTLSAGEDITERKRSEEAKLNLEAQLRQAQKMESIGRLAGGVAHDFNNMLGVIIGHAEMALEEISPSDPIKRDLNEIRKAAERSANLTRQLLAFARKQTIAPRILNCNDAVSGMLNMLQRLIGEDIDLIWSPDANLWPVKVDPSQLDQCFANLCVNARDAIHGIGKVTIETKNMSFDDAYCDNHLDFVPGEYVMLALSDNGRGMDKDTLSHLYEPFFTTKETGKGTGLGLATVYGIVKQNNGFIQAYSELGQGTTFKIFLPRYTDKVDFVQTRGRERTITGGKETILLVEDEPSILDMSKRMLENLGYTVIPASTPTEAIRLAESHDNLQVLLTDVVMPEMNGRDLARRLLTLFPNIKTLFMSGYTSDVIAHHGVLDKGVQFIEKPFSMKALAEKLRDVLTSGDSSHIVGTDHKR